MPGAFDRLKKDLNSAATSLEKGLNQASKSAEQKWQEFSSNQAKECFRTSNVLQLVSRSSGRALQIVMSPTGQLVVDGCGAIETPQFNTHWTVLQESNVVVRLHNNNNYLSVKDGCTYVAHYPDPQSAGYETRFRVKAIDKNFVSLMSESESGRHIGVMPNGQLKPALACGTEPDGQWGVRVVYTPYQQPVKH